MVTTKIALWLFIIAILIGNTESDKWWSKPIRWLGVIGCGVCSILVSSGY